MKFEVYGTCTSSMRWRFICGEAVALSAETCLDDLLVMMDRWEIAGHTLKSVTLWAITETWEVYWKWDRLDDGASDVIAAFGAEVASN
jgi:hypothetical protein